MPKTRCNHGPPWNGDSVDQRELQTLQRTKAQLLNPASLPQPAAPTSNASASTNDSAVRKTLARRMGQAIDRYRLIEDGDHILVAVSGGKDSYTLLDLLAGQRARAPIEFKLTAVHVDQGQPGYDGSRLRAWLDAFGVPFEIIERDTYTKVLEVTPEGKAFCGACARFRRGILYNTGERLGCNKIALGHHREDLLETFLMNVLYSGKLHTMPPRFKTQDGRFEVIRPLAECAESDIEAHAQAVGYPILPCNLCGSQSDLKRQRVRSLLGELEAETPDVRGSLLRALKNVQPERLLDLDLIESLRDSSSPPSE